MDETLNKLSYSIQNILIIVWLHYDCNAWLYLLRAIIYTKFIKKTKTTYYGAYNLR